MVLSFTVFVSKSQDLHFADVSSMAIWYNQSLKMDDKIDLRLNYRDVQYQSLLAFKTGSGFLNLPFYKKDGVSKSYMSATAGGNFDQSNGGYFKNNTFLLGLSYAQQLSNNQTYLAAGFQLTNTRSSYGLSGVTFPDQFDKYGPLPTGTQDPLRAGRAYSWTSLNAGISLFQNTSYSEWYVGASIRHINRPFTDELRSEAYRLAPAFGLQAGIDFKTDDSQFGIYGFANLQAYAYEYLLGTRFKKTLSKPEGKSEGSSFGAGLALRVHDAVIPNIQLKFNKTTIGLNYDLNISGLKAAGYAREAYELVLIQQLN